MLRVFALIYPVLVLNPSRLRGEEFPSAGFGTRSALLSPDGRSHQRRRRKPSSPVTSPVAFFDFYPAAPPWHRRPRRYGVGAAAPYPRSNPATRLCRCNRVQSAHIRRLTFTMAHQLHSRGGTSERSPCRMKSCSAGRSRSNETIAT